MMTSETDIPPVAMGDSADLESAEPIAGPIPLPRPRRHHVAAMIGVVPLPRPKPSDALPEPDLPQIDRHAVE